MNSQEKYIQKWFNVIQSAKAALSNNDYELYDNLIHNANSIVDDLKRDNLLTYECKNFGLANHIIESSMPRLFKHNKGAVKELIKTIKEDKNLLNQFKFFNALNKYKSLDNNELKEALDLFYQSVDVKTINESNGKLSDLVKKYDLKSDNLINEEQLMFYENCDFLFKHPKRLLNNLAPINESISKVVEYVNHNIKHCDESSNDFYANIDEFNKKINSKLNQEEKKFVKAVILNKNDDSEKIFKNLKNECLETIDKLINSSKLENEKDGLKSIKSQIIEKEYKQSSLINDISGLLEIKEILQN